TIHFVKEKFEGLSMVLSTSAIALIESLKMTILLHFLETTPSILRPTSILLVYLPIRATSVISSKVFSYHLSKDLLYCSITYAYHLLIIVLTMLRTRSRLPFSLYLFDLMPTPEDEQIRTNHEKVQMEKTALPPSNPVHEE
ncbi:hypothetical protein PMAYCL1PPCAC_05950, partial [Pristionchus mayeri]